MMQCCRDSRAIDIKHLQLQLTIVASSLLLAFPYYWWCVIDSYRLQLQLSIVVTDRIASVENWLHAVHTLCRQYIQVKQEAHLDLGCIMCLRQLSIAVATTDSSIFSWQSWSYWLFRDMRCILPAGTHNYRVCKKLILIWSAWPTVGRGYRFTSLSLSRRWRCNLGNT